jgi:CrcB protein
MIELLVVGVGGFVGAIVRYGVSGLIHRYYGGPFPLGTLTVNVLGCFLIGGLMTLVEDRQLLAPATRAFVMIGFLGSLTTFSTLGYETVELLRGAELRFAAASLLANGVLGVGAVLVGRATVKILGI